MPTEVELKFSVRREDALPLKRCALFAGLKATKRRFVSVYYDTPTHLLTKKGIALRLRRAGGRWVQTLKTRGSAHGGLHERGEWEMALPRGEIDLDLFTGPALEKSDVDKWADDLRPVFTTDFIRTTWLFESPPGNRIEVALDQGKLLSGRREQPISELELELLAGDQSCLFDLAALLQDDFALRPESLSKAERGYRLLRNESLKPVKAVPVEIDPDLSPAAALRLAVRSGLAQLEANEPGVLISRDGEFVHQARIALRRLRSTLQFAAHDDPVAAKLGNELRPFARALGHARDWDVLIDQTLPPIAACFGGDTGTTSPGGDTDIRRMLTRARRNRAAARLGVRNALTSRAYFVVLLSLSRWLNDPPPAPLDQIDVTRFAAARIRKRHKRLMRDGQNLAVLPSEQRHRVRIDIKRLRYGPECFVSLFAGTAARRYLTELETAQDALGKINDGIVASRLIAGLKPAANLDYFIRGWIASRNTRLLKIAQASLERLDRGRPFWKQPRRK